MGNETKELTKNKKSMSPFFRIVFPQTTNPYKLTTKLYILLIIHFILKLATHESTVNVILNIIKNTIYALYLFIIRIRHC